MSPRSKLSGQSKGDLGYWLLAALATITGAVSVQTLWWTWHPARAMYACA